MNTLRELTGQRFGRLVVESRGPNNKKKRAQWNCRCDCGALKLIQADYLLNRNTSSCGCLPPGFKHGGTHHELYEVWRGMRRRCLTPSEPSYPRYGGRGIRICERWSEFANFLADMGERPTRSHTLDRINNDGNYEPGNCRWATPVEQGNNRSDNAIVQFHGQEMTVAELCRITGVARTTVTRRLEMGWTPERAVSEPIGSSSRRMSPEQVAYIREVATCGNYSRLARELGVDHSTIRRIAIGASRQPVQP